MLNVGITGGIGAGKSIVCQVWKCLGIPVINADEVASIVMNTQPDVKQQLIALLGQAAYDNGLPNRAYIRGKIFADAQLLASMNAIVHPAVKAYSAAWWQQQSTPYALKESALLFETGAHKQLDLIICVYTPLAMRIDNVKQRSRLTDSEINAIIAKQIDDNLKMAQSDYIIDNSGTKSVIAQVLDVHQQIVERL